MIPLNLHVQIEPQKKDDFIASATTTYDEVGVVVAVGEGVTRVTKGDVVYFDSWMASKFPNKEGGYSWLVPYENIKGKDESLHEEPMQGGVPAQVSYSKPVESRIAREV